LRQAANHRLNVNLNGALVALLAFVALALGGCTSSWKAPLENRSSGYAKAQSNKPPGPDARSYRVRAGDTLYAIAWRSDKDFRDIARWNGIRKPYTIYKGQWLRLVPPQRVDSRKASASKKDASRKPSKPAKQKSQRTESKSQSVARQPVAKSTPVASRGPLKWTWPYRGKLKSTFKRGDRLRKGIKIVGKEGDAIRAAEAGKVVYSGSGLIGYGRLIIIKHNEKYLSAYGHNRKLLVKQGQQITKGQQIAEMGLSNDGRPLLHFEIRRDGKPVNPLALLPRR